MDCRSGEIIEYKSSGLREFSDVKASQKAHAGERLLPLSDKQIEFLRPLGANRRKNWMRNQPCPCESGLKFKKCCWSKFS